MSGRPWFVGAWQRRSIEVPGSAAVEPCDAWWVQTEDLFVDVRVARSGQEDNGLPFSSTRAFGGRFEVTADGVRWHVDLDSGGVTPRTDGALGVDLSIDPDDPQVMIEDAPGRFREVWVRPQVDAVTTSLVTPTFIVVAVGDVCAAVWVAGDGATAGEVRGDGWSFGVGDLATMPVDVDVWFADRPS